MSLFELAPREGAKPKQLRKKGIIPVGLVEKNHQTRPLQMTVAGFKAATRGGGHTHIDVHIDGERGPRKAILKRIDMDPMSHDIICITLQEVSAEDRVKMDVPIVGVGDNEATKEGGVTLTLVTDHLKLRGRVDSLPEVIQVDVSTLQAGGTITAGDIELPEGIELLQSTDTIVFSNTIDKEPELEAPEETETAEVPTDSEAGETAETSEGA